MQMKSRKDNRNRVNKGTEGEIHKTCSKGRQRPNQLVIRKTDNQRQKVSDD